MKLSTFEKRTKDILKQTNGYKMALAILTTGQTCRPCWVSRNGRIAKNMDYTNDVISALEAAGLIQGKDFEVGNDAPKGGKTGNYIRMKNRRKMITA